MNESNKKNLTQLYREHARNDAALPDADSLVSLALGNRSAETDDAIEQVAASPLNGKLLHLTRDLQPLSIDLSMDLEALLGRSYTSVRHRQTHGRRTLGARPRWRIAVAAMAASLIAVAGLWTAHRLNQSAETHVAATTHTQAIPDHIFSGFDEKTVAAHNDKRSDEIFRGRFLPDEIFKSNRNDG